MAAGTIEKVQVMLQAFTNGFSRGIERAQTQLKRAGKNIQEFGQVMHQPMETFRSMNQNAKTMTTTGGKFANGIRMWTHGLRGFRMEMLGVMFFGMMLQRVFLGLLSPVMEAFGVMDIFRVMLLTLFLPVMEMIYPYLLSFMEWFMDLPAPAKKLIGIIVLAGVAFGTFLMVLGSFALGIGSIIQIWPTLTALFAGVGAFLVPIIAIVMGIIDIFTQWGVSTRKLVRGILTVIAGVAGVVAVVLGAPALLVAAIVAAVVAIIYAVVRYWDQIKAAFKAGWDWVKEKSLAAFNWLKDKWNKAKQWVKDLFSWGNDDSSSGSSSSSSMKKYNDFIWRPGQGAAAISPNDTLVGFKGSPPDLGGGSGGNVTNNFYGFTRDDLQRELDERDRKLVNDIGRLVKQ